MLVILVAIGGAVGSVARLVLSTVIQQRAGAGIPVGTLVVNVAGGLIIGFILRYSLGSTSIGAEGRALLASGFCGGFTTFSAFSYETLGLIESGDYRRAAVYVVSSVALSLIATFAGIAIAKEVLVARHGG